MAVDKECEKCDEKPGSLSRVKSVVSGVASNNPGFVVERKLIAYSVFSLLFLLICDAVGYFLLFNSIPDFINIFAPLVILLAAGIISSLCAVFYFRSFRIDFSHMPGMMIGMTLGMVPGFMAGAIIGATNGMFVGSVIGMAVGIAIGAWAGKCCGIMGFMEGLMAGIMAGTMGAMLSVMMLTDNLILFLYILFPLCIIILAGLCYMMYKEGKAEGKEPSQTSLVPFLLAAVLMNIAFSWLMIYGPKSAIVWGG